MYTSATVAWSQQFWRTRRRHQNERLRKRRREKGRQGKLQYYTRTQANSSNIFIFFCDGIHGVCVGGFHVLIKARLHIIFWASDATKRLTPITRLPRLFRLIIIVEIYDKIVTGGGGGQFVVYSTHDCRMARAFEIARDVGLN